MGITNLSPLKLYQPTALERLVSLMSFGTYQIPSSPDFSPSAREVARINTAAQFPIYYLYNPLMLSVLAATGFAFSYLLLLSLSLLAWFDYSISACILMPIALVLFSRVIYSTIEHITTIHQQLLYQRAYFPDFTQPSHIISLFLNDCVDTPHALCWFHFISILTSTLDILPTLSSLLLTDIMIIFALSFSNILAVFNLILHLSQDLLTLMQLRTSVEAINQNQYMVPIKQWIPHVGSSHYVSICRLNLLISHCIHMTILIVNLPLRMLEVMMSPMVHIYGLYRPQQAFYIKHHIINAHVSHANYLAKDAYFSFKSELEYH